MPQLLSTKTPRGFLLNSDKEMALGNTPRYQQMGIVREMARQLLLMLLVTLREPLFTDREMARAMSSFQISSCAGTLAVTMSIT
ncbi:MAG: hypothetical protein EA358_03785 [Flavobacteriales bacterium]|nr:MAG: hypothetical protein EA358_03785 [Flavobacteriales bacterium]